MLHRVYFFLRAVPPPSRAGLTPVSVAGGVDRGGAGARGQRDGRRVAARRACAAADHAAAARAPRPAARRAAGAGRAGRARRRPGTQLRLITIIILAFLANAYVSLLDTTRASLVGPTQARGGLEFLRFAGM